MNLCYDKSGQSLVHVGRQVAWCLGHGVLRVCVELVIFITCWRQWLHRCVHLVKLHLDVPLWLVCFSACVSPNTEVILRGDAIVSYL